MGGGKGQVCWPHICPASCCLQRIEWQVGLPDGVSPTTEGRGTQGCQSRGATKLDTDAGFPPKGIAGAFQRGCYRGYSKWVNLKRGSGASLGFLWCWQLSGFSIAALLTKNWNMSIHASTSEEAPCGPHIPDHDLCPTPLNPFIL